MHYRHLFSKQFFLTPVSFLITCSVACSQSKSSAPVIQFTKQMIAAESFESVDVFDVNNDGKPDIVSGSFWYEGPDFFKAHYIGPVKRYNEYWDDFSTIPLDVNGDGKMDFITGSWFSNSLHWKENPGNSTGIWTDHLIDSTGNVEAAEGWDVDKDGTIEIVPNNPNFPLKFYKLEKDAGGKTLGKFTKTEVALKQGHGLGFGDVNADGRGDFIISDGWLEAPANPLKGTWILHKEFNLGQASVPVLVEDVNGDGKNDIIAGQGHDYGLDWYEQTMDKSGKTNWIKHAIDPNNSMFHTMQWVDIDGDGKPELITGKRYRAHDTDPGVHDPAGLYYYKWNGESFTKQIISYGPLGEGKGTGLYFAVADLRGTGRKDIVVAGKDGLYVFYNDGPAAAPNKEK